MGVLRWGFSTTAIEPAPSPELPDEKLERKLEPKAEGDWRLRGCHVNVLSDRDHLNVVPGVLRWGFSEAAAAVGKGPLNKGFSDARVGSCTTPEAPIPGTRRK